MIFRVPQKYFNRNYFSTGGYDTYKKDAFDWVGPTAKRIFLFVQNSASPSVLDVGCAHGLLIAELRDKYGVTVKGLEYSDYAIKNAEKSIKQNIQRGNVLKTSVFRKNSFDAVICFEVFQYLNAAEIAKATENLARWTKKWIFFCLPYKHSRHNSQKINPDKYRITALTQKECVETFKKTGVKFIASFNSGNGGDILVFKK